MSNAVKEDNQKIEGQSVELQIPELNIKQKIATNKTGDGKFSITAKPVL